jgi:hypothetical protein
MCDNLNLPPDICLVDEPYDSAQGAFLIVSVYRGDVALGAVWDASTLAGYPHNGPGWRMALPGGHCLSEVEPSKEAAVQHLIDSHARMHPQRGNGHE